MFSSFCRIVMAAIIGLGAVLSDHDLASVAQTGPDDDFPQDGVSSGSSAANSGTIGGQTDTPDQEQQQIAFADHITQAIVLQIQRGSDRCDRLQVVYRIDCLREVYSQASGDAGNRPDYSAATSRLRKLSRQLKGIARSNLDEKAERATQDGKSYRAVARDALRSANQQAARAIDEAVTQLLRSAGNSQKRKVHYTRIANAVRSTKKILRS